MFYFIMAKKQNDIVSTRYLLICLRIGTGVGFGADAEYPDEDNLGGAGLTGAGS